MAKANLVLPNGTKVTLDGTPEEIHKLLSLYHERPSGGAQQQRPQAKGESPHAQKSAGGPKGHLRELITDEFFKTPRSLKAIQEKLAENGHIYPQTHLSPGLLDLIKRKELRRFKETGIWVYVNR